MSKTLSVSVSPSSLLWTQADEAASIGRVASRSGGSRKGLMICRLESDASSRNDTHHCWHFCLKWDTRSGLACVWQRRRCSPRRGTVSLDRHGVFHGIWWRRWALGCQPHASIWWQSLRGMFSGFCDKRSGDLENLTYCTEITQIILEQSTLKSCQALKMSYCIFSFKSVPHFLISAVIRELSLGRYSGRFTKTNRLNLFLQDEGDVLSMSKKVIRFPKTLILGREHVWK